MGTSAYATDSSSMVWYTMALITTGLARKAGIKYIHGLKSAYNCMFNAVFGTFGSTMIVGSLYCPDYNKGACKYYISRFSLILDPLPLK